MDDNLIGLIGIASAILLGLLAMALAILFGLRAFRKDVLSDLSPIKEKVIIIQETVQNVWDVVRRSPVFGATGTVVRSLKNLGKVTITAEPLEDRTNYFIVTDKSVILDSGRIISLSEDTGLNQREREMFGGRLVRVFDLLPHQLKLEVPSTNPKECTEYISFFLNWLDTEYLESLPKISDFEEPIEI